MFCSCEGFQEHDHEIERLRAENQTIIDKAFQQCEMDRKRIEELEEELTDARVEIIRMQSEMMEADDE